ncbi:MAG: single-stranded DNA-binding protein [Bacteroidales bacterium]|nr:single-stranded DNA-binding protein [Bacteroidales bacterium]
MSINSVVLMGRLVTDPELKTTPKGVSVTTFRIAVDRGYVKSGEERKVDFIDIVAWRHDAEFVCKHFSKGSLIAVVGNLQSRSYEAKDGSKRSVLEVVADHVSFTGERRDQVNAASQPTGTPSEYSGYSNNEFVPMPGDDEDLPF